MKIYRLGDFSLPSSFEKKSKTEKIVLEIGFGDGRFWQEHIKSYETPPFYIGIELSKISILKASKKLNDCNGILTRIPAEFFLYKISDNAEFDEIIINFPDPWPKSNHLQNRLLNKDFFVTVKDKLKHNGFVSLTTDHEEYFNFALENAKNSGLEIRIEEPPSATLKTKYALKWQEFGMPIFHAKFICHQIQSKKIFYKEEKMPHSIVKLPDNFDINKFEKKTLNNKDFVIVLLDFYKSIRKKGFVVLCYIEEKKLKQEILVEILQREKDYLIKVSNFGAPLITDGVKGAVSLVTKMLEESGAKAIYKNY